MKFCTLILLFTPLAAAAQVVQPGKVLQRSVENRFNRKVEQGVNSGLDKIEEDAKNKNKNKNKDSAGLTSSSGVSGKGSGASSGGVSTGLISYSKFDFIPGEKVLSLDNFENDAIGDFPATWNTSSTGEIVTVEGKEGKWLKLGHNGSYLPEYVTTLPENFTYQFDLICNPDFSYYSDALNLVFAQMKSASKEFTQWKRFGHGTNGTQLAFHPTDAGNTRGTLSYNIYKDGASVMKNEIASTKFHAKVSNHVKVSIWRQKTRLRVYLNDEKILDLPRAFDPAVTYTNLVFWTGSPHSTNDVFYISNMRLAVGAPDTRNKLISEGKFVTRGILFDVNSDRIKPESFGVLKEIADVLKENPTVKVKIVGHTDSDGDEKLNLALSENRAIAVKEALFKQFGIDKNRIETTGKGESEPSDPNTTVAGKANNRRVEFIKI
jgi:outer membrane protein OmpA-like peptidoglycan-associated protein